MDDSEVKRGYGIGRKLFVFDEDVIKTDDIITYCFLVQEALRWYRNVVDSKRWEPTDSKKISKDEPLLLMAYTVAIESLVNKTVEKIYFQKAVTKGKTINLE